VGEYAAPSFLLLSSCAADLSSQGKHAFAVRLPQERNG